MSDLISRQDALDILNEQIEQCNKALGSFDISAKDEYAIKVERASLKAYKEQLENLPIVEPKRGYWIESHEHIYVGNGVAEWTNFFCSECDAPNDKPTDFCPNCGTDMRGEQE